MNEQVQEHFSSADWLLIPASVRKEDIADKLELAFLSECKEWNNCPILLAGYENPSNYNINNWHEYLLQRADKILISSFINGYYIIEGKCLRYIYETLCKRLSAKCGIYYFSIDLWEYRCAYGYYEKGQEIRFYCAELDTTCNLHEEDRGHVLSYENGMGSCSSICTSLAKKNNWKKKVISDLISMGIYNKKCIFASKKKTNYDYIPKCKTELRAEHCQQTSGRLS